MPGPHDLLARYTFAHPERAAAELRAVLPPHVVSAVDWTSLRREPGSVVDPELRETESDLLFSARLHEGGSLLLYVLLEHQSSVDRWIAGNGAGGTQGACPLRRPGGPVELKPRLRHTRAGRDGGGG
ncbi:MAG TPA: Rpn family recombination-promoting nuclease/putative transposase [Archangium sp.]|nr:Rpn family recombination-promoting nuclease/putative transposase [Archangium sp.]